MHRPRSPIAASLLFAATLAAPGWPARRPCPTRWARSARPGQINVALLARLDPVLVDGADNRPVGYSIELCQRIVAAIARSRRQPEPRASTGSPARSVERLAAVKAGRADLECANTTATISRMADVDFSSLVFVDSGGFLVRADGPIQQFSEFAGKRVGVIGRHDDRAAPRARSQGPQRSTRRRPGARRPRGPGDARGRHARRVRRRQDQARRPRGHARNPAALRVLAVELSYEPYAFALPRGDSSLRARRQPRAHAHLRLRRDRHASSRASSASSAARAACSRRCTC